MSSESPGTAGRDLTWTPLVPLADLPTDGGGATIERDGFRVAVFHLDGVVHVLDDECPHAGASLGAGVCVDGDVTCPWHGWHFRLNDGANTDGLPERVGVHPVRVTEAGVVEAALG